MDESSSQITQYPSPNIVSHYHHTAPPNTASLREQHVLEENCMDDGMRYFQDEFISLKMASNIKKKVHKEGPTICHYAGCKEGYSAV